ncbi:MAG: Sapep family Mn(2+)-dependent dipeptidase [Oscillospiraceae bacterium]|nr:Sapep family Mn(2+)-dependent dipeptidase [Oscillospiraceae bacterium]
MNKIFSYLDSHFEDMVKDLERLIKIPSVMGDPSPDAPFGEHPAAALNEMLGICRESGLSVRNIDNYMGTADMFPAEETPELGILCHLDVVPAGNGWSVPPFSLTRKDGKLIGRGAIDDKGPAVAALYAVRAVKDAGITLNKNVRLIFGTNEENGSADLARYRRKEALPQMLFTPDGSYPLINAEKGMLRISYTAKLSPDIISVNGGAAINAVPEFAEAVINAGSVDTSHYKDRFDGVTIVSEAEGDKIKLTARGKSAHASTPESGKNAVTALLTVLSEISGDPVISALVKMFPYGETDGASAGIKCSDQLGALTSVLSVISAENGVLEAKQDIRFPVTKTSSDILDKLKNAAEAAGLKMNADMISEPHHAAEDSEFIRDLLEVYENVTGEKGHCIAIGGGTYVHETDTGVAFGAEFPGEENNMHGADEFITEESLLKNAKIFAAAIVRLCSDEKL